MLGSPSMDFKIDKHDSYLLHILTECECKSEDEAIGMLDIALRDHDNLASINVSTKFGITPLIIAVKKNYPALVEYLHQKGADPNKVVAYEGQYSLTAINFAAKLGHVEIGKILVKHKPIVDICDVQGAYKSPLFDAIECKQLEFLKFLCESLADSGEKIYILSDVLQNIFNIGHNSNENEMISFIDVLLDHHAIINVTTLGGRTLLIEAIERNYLELVKYLCKRGVNVDQVLTQINCGNTAINFAAELGYVDIAEILVEHGATINVDEGNTRISPLYNAVEYNQTKFVRFLCDQGININVSEQFDLISPLYIALTMSDEERNLEIIHLLCEFGAEVTANHLKILIASIESSFKVDDELIFGVLIAHIKDITTIEQFLKEDDSQIDNHSEIVAKAKKIISQSFQHKCMELKLEFIKGLASEEDSLFHWILILDTPGAILQDLLFSSLDFRLKVDDNTHTSKLIKENFFKNSIFNDHSEHVESYLHPPESSKLSTLNTGSTLLN